MREIREILKDFSFEMKSLKDVWNPVPSIPETGATFEENALLKARWVWRRRKCRVLADDSGLEVDFLDGAPGVTSARYAGPGGNDAENLAKLLKALDGVPPEKRRARFRCVMVMLEPDGSAVTASGACEGRIGSKPAGGGGFGYDPVFIPDGYDRTFAELDAGVKNMISHRARALANLHTALVSRGIGG